jgi:hypothetical protein
LIPNVGSGDQTATQRLADLKERIGQTERRLPEIRQELVSLESQSVDEGDLRAVLAQFGPIWELLNSREQVRIIRTLIEHIAYNVKTNKVTVSFRSAAIRGMCRGAGRKDANES